MGFIEAPNFCCKKKGIRNPCLISKFHDDGNVTIVFRIQIKEQLTNPIQLYHFHSYDTIPRFLAVELQRQLIPGTIEHALNQLLITKST